MKEYLSNRAWFLRFIPLLLLYIILISFFSNPDKKNDQQRYIWYAENLTEGYFSPPDNIEFRNGPGYPLVLAPFLAADAPLIVPNLLNALFLLCGLWFFYFTATRFVKAQTALICSYLLGLYPPLLRWSIYLYSEPLAFMLICGLGYFLVRLIQTDNPTWKEIAGISLCLGYLILTKVVFLYVTFVVLLLTGIIFLWKREAKFIKLALAFVGGFLVFSPFLIYTYSLTSIPMYSGSSGGQILYFRATPFEGEYGNWFAANMVLGSDSLNQDLDAGNYCNLAALKQNHGPFIDSIQGLTAIEQDQAYSARAKEYMRKHPQKYLQNTIANFSRLWFHFPFSYRQESLGALGYMIPNAFVLLVCLLSLYPAYKARKRLPISLLLLLAISLVFVGGITLLGGRGRHLIMAIPFLLLFQAFVWDQLVSFKILIHPPKQPE